MRTFQPMAAASRAIQRARRREPLVFDDGPVGDIERDALAEGLPMWFKAKEGNLYLAANVSWPGLYKIGCTRRTVDSRMRQLSGAGVATPWVACQTWRVHDAYGLEAMVHRACAAWQVKGELFQAPVAVLKKIVSEVIASDKSTLEDALRLYLLGTSLRA